MRTVSRYKLTCHLLAADVFPWNFCFSVRVPVWRPGSSLLWLQHKRWLVTHKQPSLPAMWCVHWRVHRPAPTIFCFACKQWALKFFPPHSSRRSGRLFVVIPALKNLHFRLIRFHLFQVKSSREQVQSSRKARDKTANSHVHFSWS